MKLNQMALANAFGVLAAVYYVACYFLALLAPEVYKSVALTWFHMIDLSVAWRDAPMGFGLGIVTFTASSWVSGWLLGAVYNKFVK
ncbi:hypothetical protein A3F62_05275 [Candidatus Woesebacteria bacterium RIFCSPHIGHO2_12_FULL_44_11]|nr:MAG: hypothetical protein A3F62_05275 [Candidatus Woesebacteria bacterium RIFCSPHIGHO2_12_FULL_44_11]